MKMVFDPFKSHLIKWMKNNGWKLLAAIAGILVGVVAAEIITSVAITAAFPMIINSITPYQIADAIKSATPYPPPRIRRPRTCGIRFSMDSIHQQLNKLKPLIPQYRL
ncbi:hypothetical protein JI735_24335 [Paenibacillus sonchi]|uniref:Uncharacterized protein n=1 Tax=Paenibacillus sonchi TaxID=373687 RepID=A0A974SAQ4_9BACL|nr:hypothetical protein JI735_24335 [Paenibacillus sonchi]